MTVSVCRAMTGYVRRAGIASVRMIMTECEHGSNCGCVQENDSVYAQGSDRECAHGNDCECGHGSGCRKIKQAALSWDQPLATQQIPLEPDAKQFLADIHFLADTHDLRLCFSCLLGGQTEVSKRSAQ
eukprot:scaffold20966_cov19-Tisochrysis_lutea.AAC.2